MRKSILVTSLFLSAFILNACAGLPGNTGSYASIPAGKAYSEGKEIFFSHTEVSDPAVGEKLTNMMKSPVIVVPSLGKIPAELTATVYVFENGKAGTGPLGFQEDVFTDPPGSPSYTPLRRITFVAWKDAGNSRKLLSAAEVLEADSKGELELKKTDIVVNMPFMVWDGGKR